MLKKLRIMLLIGIMTLLFSTVVNGQAVNDYIDKSQLNNGIIKINADSKKNMALRISKDDVILDYILNGNNDFPLQLGNGNYNLMVLENINGKKYKVLHKETVTLKLDNSNKVYLQSIQLINWNNEMDAIKKAKELTKDAKNDREKMVAIYNHIINNVNYDYNKAKIVKANYVPVIDETLKSGQAICYDYSSLFAAMLRSEDIPTKLLMGRKNDIKDYHAWNQVYLQDVDKWLTIDTTYDAGRQKVSMIKDESQYKVEKQY